MRQVLRKTWARADFTWLARARLWRGFTPLPLRLPGTLQPCSIEQLLHMRLVQLLRLELFW